MQTTAAEMAERLMGSLWFGMQRRNLKGNQFSRVVEVEVGKGCCCGWYGGENQSKARQGGGGDG